MSIGDSKAPTEDEGLCEWLLPVTGTDEPLRLVAGPGGITAVVGANGSGKSALGFWLQKNSGNVPVDRLIAHRRLWIEHAGPNITSGQREQQVKNIQSYDIRPDSRWVDHAQAVRPNIALFDLIASHNARNDRLARQVDGGASIEDIRSTLLPSPINRLNSVLSRCSFSVQVALAETGSLDALRDGMDPYPISQMSDGEKSALLLAAEVLTAETSSIQIIDEPERHMHRSISGPLMEALADERPDCHFVILTHDLDLAQSLARQGATLLSLHGCDWQGESVQSWEAYALEGAEMPDAVRAALLGGRQQVLFVEGTRESLDLKLLGLLLPGWSIEPAGGCTEVIRATKGLRTSATYHWMEVAGVVDRDRRTEAECAALRSNQVFPLGMNEIENVYLLSPIIERLAESQSPILETAAATLVGQARDAAINALNHDETIEHLASVAALAVVHRKLGEASPSRAMLQDAGEQLVISLGNPLGDERDRLRGLVQERDLDTILRDYSVRDSGLRNCVARALGYQGITHLESAARHCMRQEPTLAAQIQDLAGPLPLPTQRA